MRTLIVITPSVIRSTVVYPFGVWLIWLIFSSLGGSGILVAWPGDPTAPYLAARSLLMRRWVPGILTGPCWPHYWASLASRWCCFLSSSWNVDAALVDGSSLLSPPRLFWRSGGLVSLLSPPRLLWRSGGFFVAFTTPSFLTFRRLVFVAFTTPSFLTFRRLVFVAFTTPSFLTFRRFLRCFHHPVFSWRSSGLLSLLAAAYYWSVSAVPWYFMLSDSRVPFSLLLLSLYHVVFFVCSLISQTLELLTLCMALVLCSLRACVAGLVLYTGGCCLIVKLFIYNLASSGDLAAAANFLEVELFRKTHRCFIFRFLHNFFCDPILHLYMLVSWVLTLCCQFSSSVLLFRGFFLWWFPFSSSENSWIPQDWRKVLHYRYTIGTYLFLRARLSWRMQVSSHSITFRCSINWSLLDLLQSPFFSFLQKPRQKYISFPQRSLIRNDLILVANVKNKAWWRGQGKHHLGYL